MIITTLMLAIGISAAFAQEKDYVILIHGGAGNMKAMEENPEQQTQYFASLETALRIGEKKMEETGNGVDVVLEVIHYFESNPLFNAGVGATVSAAGLFELDACIMEGRDLSAGAVAGVTHVKHPIDAAYAVKTKSEHVLLMGGGAEEFAAENGLEMVEDNSYFATPKTMQWVEEFKAQSKKMGTVGCVVLDRNGNLVAGTSTGGMLGKKYGRVGDAPLVGSGTYADNEGVAVSCTGHGEYFIRHNVSANLNFRVKLLKQPVKEAARELLFNELNAKEGRGGLIAVDKKGNFTLDFNTPGMFRGYIYKEKGSSESVGEVGVLTGMRPISKP